MDPTDDRSLDAFAPGVGAIADADILSDLPADPVDRSMLVMQYGLALIVAIAAVLLTQAS